MRTFIRKGLLIFISLSLVFLSSCGFKDIDKRIFVMAIGIDLTENKEKPYKLTLKLAIASGALKGGQGGEKYTYVTMESENLAKAFRMMKTHVDKETDFGHSRIIIVGKSILDKDLRDVMDLIIRRRDIQMISWVGVGEPSAEKVLKTEPPSEMAGSISLPNFFSDNGVESSYIVSTFLFDLRRKMLESGIDPILPIIRADKSMKKFMVNKSIIAPKNNNNITLSSQETKIYNLLVNNSRKAEITINKNKMAFSVALFKTKAKYKIITAPNSEPVIKMKIKMVGIIEESNESVSPSLLKKYNKLVNQKTKKDVHQLLTKFQENNVDPLGFGLRYKATRLHTRDTYKEWTQMYPNVKFDVTVETSIKSTGTIE
ncbi:Ger(x)C family spore germination protein [Lederbergia wuyishanensis]|uniref:Spore germination protein KC n=1 Tax=Lederbergia wuyishanensis TaxID=1347903 RepID=A0ABU0DA59_9BACI|nr:Ger(x)C family spore germination protein [Lederbergia wuyishanensis]MCJ8009970.1 Ger(x)C family spore germination protein [Lederbergia wuyishanensis]MDQ0345318.1 spore germination protein KC [Lederbergia wuyishanensis]